MGLLVYFILELLIVYTPFLIKKKITKERLLVWSTVWVTIFTELCLTVILTAFTLITTGYTLTSLDYVLSLLTFGIIIGNIFIIKYLNKKLIAKKC